MWEWATLILSQLRDNPQVADYHFCNPASKKKNHFLFLFSRQETTGLSTAAVAFYGVCMKVAWGMTLRPWEWVSCLGVKKSTKTKSETWMTASILKQDPNTWKSQRLFIITQTANFWGNPFMKLQNHTTVTVKNEMRKEIPCLFLGWVEDELLLSCPPPPPPPPKVISFSSCFNLLSVIL